MTKLVNVKRCGASLSDDAGLSIMMWSDFAKPAMI